MERAKAAEDVVTHVAATQTYGNVVEFAMQTKDVQAKEAVETCIASVQTEAMGQPDAQMGETEKKLLDAVATEAATETSASGVERECRHEVEVQNLKRDLEAAEKDITLLEKISAELDRHNTALLHKIKEMRSVRSLTDTRSVRNNPVRKRDGWKKR